MITRLSKNFTLNELIYSNTAKLKNINNHPSDEVIENLSMLSNEVLQPIRDKWGNSINVNSGYRSPELNKAVGGAKNSKHMLGLAADISVGGKLANKELFNMIREMINNKELSVDNLIDEKGFSWIHVDIQEDINNNRNKIFSL